MNLKLKYALITISAILILGYLVSSLWYFSGKDKNLVCSRFEIELADKDKMQLINQKDIAVLLEQNDLNPMGKTIVDIQTESIEAALRKNLMIKEAECFISPSGTVRVRVTQRCPKFRVVGFESYYIDTDRKPMPVSSNYAAYVPVVSGRVTKTMAMGKLFDFITFLEGNPFWNAQIEQINVRNDLKIELIPRVGEAVIVLGSFDNYEAKLAKLHKLYEKGFNLMGWNRYKYIDLQYKDQVVCGKIASQQYHLAKPKVELEEKIDSIIAKKI